jgi:hypothetical protein
MVTNVKSIVAKLGRGYARLGQVVSAAQVAPTRGQAQFAMFALGLVLLGGGLALGAHAQGLETNYNDERIAGSVNAILTYIEGSFGALVMVAAGIGAILSSAFGQYKAALGCLVVAVGSFILRSMLATFFNDINVQE